ncbi:MAG TPA: MBL fold metallo-hydrolase [Thermoleophilia bacterium]|nr:MBL fold metallo-hydrolase [Thermoleophilia bacterium]
MRLPIAETWFSATPAGAGVTLLTEPYVHEFLRANLWLIGGRDRDLLVDTGNGIAPLLPAARVLQEHPHKPLLAVVTHTHSDHMGGLHEFPVRLVHRLEAEALALAADAACLVTAQFPSGLLAEIAADGLELPEVLLTASPREGFDPATFAVVATTATDTLDEGDTIDLGDHVFTVLHLPGHSPGSIGLWEEKSGILFSGDAIYRDGSLLDQMPGSDVGAYLKTMERLCDLPVSTVHGGHAPSFARPQLVAIAKEYLARRGCPKRTSYTTGGWP